MLHRQWDWWHQRSVQANATQVGNSNQLPVDGGGGTFQSNASSTITWGANCYRAHSSAPESTATVGQPVGSCSCQRVPVFRPRYLYDGFLMFGINFILGVAFKK
jgi:hypothetical protein